MKIIYSILIIIFSISLPAVLAQTNNGELVFTSKGKINYELKQDEKDFLDSLQYYSFLFFMNEINPELGIVKDRTAEWSAASIASTGFALPVYAIGAERGWISREKAADMTFNILQFFSLSEQSSRPDATGYKGFYYHFLDMRSGKRTWESELSTIDTALLIAGVIFARQYFNQVNDLEKEIREIADKLVNRLDWNYFEIEEEGEYKNSVSMGWRPEKGFHHMGWTGYNEALILYVLAVGGNLENPDSAYKAWLSKYDWRTPYPEKSHVVFPPMFGHQYSHIFIDFRGIQDSFMIKKGIDYFDNSKRATYVQKYYAIDNPLNWIGYDSLCWGLTACDGPGEKYNYDGKKFLSYAGRGTSGPELVYFDDGTIAPTAAAGSIPFAPEISIPTLMNIHKLYSPKGLWGPYGFYDSFNPTLEWINPDYIGIDQGPIVIMIENFKSGLVWNYFMKDPVIQKGLARLGFKNRE